MKVLSQLTTPLRYLSIVGDGKKTIDVLVPIILGVVSTGILLGVNAPLLSSGGVVDRVNELLQVLVGFYVASLAAVSTFDGMSLNQKVQSASLGSEDITRRSLLSYLFAYLAFLSLALYIFGVLVMVAPTALGAVAAIPYVRPVLLGAYAVLCWNLVAVTLLGLHYLADRINRPDPVIIQIGLGSDGDKPDTETPPGPASPR